MRRPPFKRDDGIHLTKGNERIIKRKKKKERERKKRSTLRAGMCLKHSSSQVLLSSPFSCYIYNFVFKSFEKYIRPIKKRGFEERKTCRLDDGRDACFSCCFFSSSDTSLRFGMKGLCSSVRTLSFYRGGAVGGEGSCIILRSGTRSPRVYPKFRFLHLLLLLLS